VLLLDDFSSRESDIQLHSIAHGVVTLQQLALDYGAERRRLRVRKMRGIDFRGGYHDFIIQTGGIEVFPRLVAAEHHKAFVGELAQSGVAELDALLGGGLERGTSTLLVGGAGVGKSSLAVTYAVGAAKRGEHVAMFAFDEGLGTLFARACGLGVPLQDYVDNGLITIQQIDPAEMSPGRSRCAGISNIMSGNPWIPCSQGRRRTRGD
jgi:circadian clock protein KaiC